MKFVVIKEDSENEPEEIKSFDSYREAIDLATDLQMAMMEHPIAGKYFWVDRREE